jgi:hypothetical protein
MYTSTQRGTSGISSGSIDALRIQLMKMNSQQLQAFATANQDDAIKLGLAAEADKYRKQHAQEAMAMMSGQQQKPPIAQQILQSIGQPPQQPQQPMPPQGQGQGPIPPQGQGAPMPPQQMAQGPQEMPPQGMADGGYVLPEDQGIATLPVGNMDFANGGIVAFGGGGDVPGYAGSTGSYIDPLANYLKQIGMSTQDFLAKNGIEQQQIRAAATAAKPLVPPPAVPVAQAAAETAAVKPSGLSGLSKAIAPLAAITDLMYPSSEAEKKASLPYKLGAASAVDERNIKLAEANENPEDYAARKVAEMEAAAGKQLSPDARNMAMSKFVKEKMAGNVSKGASFTTDSKYPPTPAPVGITAVVGQDGTQPTLVAPAPNNNITTYEEGIKKLLSAPGISAKNYSFTPAEIADITPTSFSKMLTDAMGPEPAKDPFAPQQEDLNKANVATKTNQKAALEADIAKQGEAFTKALENITKKEARIQTMDERNLNMALLDAGLAMMSGDSPHALVNIGKGAQVGTKKYAEGKAQIEAARDRLDDTKMKIEEFRRNEANMNAREKRAAQAEIDNAIRDGAQATLNGAMKAYDLNRQQGLSFISNSLTLKQFNVNAKNQAASQSMQAQLHADIAANQNKMQAGLASLELGYKKANPPAGSLEFYKQLGINPQAKAGLAAYSSAMGPEAKGSEAILLDWQKKNPFEKQTARKLDPIGSAQLDRMLQERVLQGSVSDKPAGAVLDQPR